MNLWSEFESVHASLVIRETSLDLDTCSGDAREKVRLQPQNTLIEEPKAFTVPSPNEYALITAKDQKVQCYECKGYVHVAQNCKKKNFCN